MLYRNANINDYNQIVLMKNRVKERVIKENLPIWLNGYPLDEYLMDDINNNFGRVIEFNNQIVAYAAFHPANIDYEEYIENTENFYSYGRVMVDDGYTGLGIGKLLISSMLDEAKSLNQKGMIIAADDCNIKAVNLYMSFGFKKINEIQFPYAYLSIFKLEF